MEIRLDYGLRGMTIYQRVARGTDSLKTSREIDVELLAFIERYATNLARWDLLAFFGRNPSICDSAHGIAAQIGRRPRIVQKELDDLAYLGLLRAHSNGEGMRYELVHTQKTRRTVMRFARRLAAPDKDYAA